MKIVKKGWTALTWGLGAYTVYRQLQSLNQAKDDLYLSLAPEQRAEWNKIFGAPGTVQIPNPIPAPLAQSQSQSPAAPVNNITQVKAGT